MAASRITVCTTYAKKKQASPFVASCKKFGIPVQEFGTERMFTTFLETKIRPLLAFARRVKTPLLMFVDGSDAFMVSPLDELLKTYDSMVGSMQSLIIGAERVVWPYPELTQALNATGLDTGLVIGRPKRIVEVLETVMEQLPFAKSDFPDRKRAIWEDDVGLWSIAIARGQIACMVDRRCQLIAALRNANPDNYTIRNGRLTMKDTGTKPHIIHCNGHRSRDRRRLYELYKTLMGEKCPSRKVPTKQIG